MYKYYEKNDYKIMEYDFDSIMEFINYLDITPITREVFDDDLGSETDNYDFCKTQSLKEAKHFCQFGYHENFEKLIELKVKLDKYIKMSNKKSQQYNYYVGYAPDVKAYLEGNPLSMLNRQNPQRKHIDIYYNSAVLSRVNTKQIFNRGAITLSLVEILENMGFSVGLHIFTMSSEKDQIHYAKFNLKQSGERVNVQKLYFPLCHPSFLRRLVFRLREETPDIKKGWKYGYGGTCDDSTIRKVIELKDNDIVICQPEEMGVKGYDIIEDANNMFDYIQNSGDDRDFEITKIKVKK